MSIRVSRAQLEALLGGKPLPPKKRSKYGAERTEYNGVTYASKAEAERAAVLDLLLAQGEIREWTRQPRFELGIKENVYVADFRVVGKDGSVWIEDVKGHKTPKFKRDIKLWRAYGPHPLHIISTSGTEIIPGKAA